MKAIQLGLLFLLITALVRADGRICAQSCNVRDNADVVYEPGKQYRYQYNGDVVTRSRETEDQESRMTVRAYVIISARTQCDLKMKVMNLVVDDVPSQDSQWFREAVEKYDLHFSYANGMVSYLCPNEEEEAVATNFKRGILSAIQAKITNTRKSKAIVYEADVLGECETEYRLSEPGEVVVNKKKTNCRANNYLPHIPSERYFKRDLTAKLPFSKNEQSCVMRLQDRVWSRVECTQELQVMELKDIFSLDNSNESSARPSLASVTVHTNLILEAGPEDTTETFAEGPFKTRASLRMDLEGAIDAADKHRNLQENVFEKISVAMNYLVATLEKDSGLSENRPSAFSHLVTLLAQVEKEEDIDGLWDTYSAEDTQRQFLLDAAVLCESYACVKLLSRLAVEAPEAFPETRVLTWLAGVHFHMQPHPHSVKSLMDLAQNNIAVKQEAVMAASSVVYRVCQQDRFICKESAKPFLDYISEEVGDFCGYGAPKEERHQVKLALRALSNAGILPQKDFPKKCYMNKMMKSCIRTHALQSYRRVDCNDLDLETPWQVLEDVDDDVGVRITAYQSLVRCAPQSPKFFSRIKNLLHKEEVNQVASYIWTHVRNLAENPDSRTQSRELALLATHHTLSAKFTTNAFRTSRNYRLAQFSEALNIGGSIDSDLIFTPESYLPRYETHRFHLDFLENSVDAFELGGEYRWMETMADRLFGREGYFENADIQKVLENLRPKRDAQNDKIQEFQDLYDEYRTKNEVDEGEGKDSPKTGLYMRMFGNEIFYVDNIFESNPWEFIKKLIGQLSTPRSFQILKQEFVSPTLLGFPLRMQVNATGSISSDYTKELSMTSMTDFNLEGQVTASAVISKDETLMVDGYGSFSGVKRHSTHISKADFGGKIQVQNGKLVDIKINVPNNELVRVSSSSKVVLYENNRQGWSDVSSEEKPYEMSDRCSSDRFRQITGLEMCRSYGRAQIQTEAGESIPGYSYDSEITLTKVDTFDFYKFYFKKERRDYEVTFDTPGSSVNRKIELKAKIRPDNVEGSLSVAGKPLDLGFKYENSDTLKKISLLFKQDSVTLGEFESSLSISREDSATIYAPKLSLTIATIFNFDLEGTVKKGSKILSIEGSSTCSYWNNPLNFKASWERTDDQQKIEGNIMMGDAFGSTTGSLFLNGEKTLVQFDTEFGQNREQLNTLTLTFDQSLLVENNREKNVGYLLVESSLGKSSVEVDYELGRRLLRFDTNITVQGVEITSKAVGKISTTETERDLEFTLGFSSPQLEKNYLAQAIYKTSPNALLAEVEVILDSALNTKLAASYLYDNDPLHLQGGFHFRLNDFIVQFVHEIDFSKPGILLVTSSDVVGPAMGALQLEAYYDKMEPFNATFDIHAGYGDKQFGLKASTASNNEWTHYNGYIEGIWFDSSFYAQHEVEWNDNNKKLSLSCEKGSNLRLVFQTDPDILFQFVFQSEPEEDPVVKYGIEKRIEGSSTTYQTYLETHGNDVFNFMAADLGDHSYSGKAKFLDSQLEISGSLIPGDDDHTEGEALVILTFPSGETAQSQVTFQHSYDGERRNLQFSAQYGEDDLKGDLVLVHKDGWFSNDETKVHFTFTTPFEGFKKTAMVFEAYNDWSQPWLAEAEWQDMKIHGELQLGDTDNLEAKLQYEDGSSCNSHLHIYHKHEGRQYKSGASLGITNTGYPWAIETITTEGENSEKRYREFSLICQSPMLQTPFEASGKYSLSDTSVDVEFEFGADSKTKLTLTGRNEVLSGTRKFSGTLNFDSPWVEPVFFSIENLQDAGSFNVSVDLRTSWEYVNTVGAEFSATYSDPKEVEAHFYITQQNLQVTMEMTHNLYEGNLVQHMQASVNSVMLNYNLNVKWDENFIPQDSEGYLTINGFLNRNLEFNFSHMKEDDKFNTKITGVFDFYQIQFINSLTYDHPLKWSSDMYINLPEDKVIHARVFLNGQKDMSLFESTFHFNSPWTKAFVTNLEIHGEDLRTVYELEATYGDNNLFTAILYANDSFAFDKTDITIEVSSTFFDNSKFSWKHNFNSGYMIELEFFYGQEINFDIKSNLKYKQGFFSQQFQGFEIGANLIMKNPQLEVKTNFGFDALFFGEIKVSWYEYIFSIRSWIPDNTVFACSISYPGEKIHTELLYQKGSSNIPNFTFKFSRNDIDIFTLSGEFPSSFPNFDAVLSIQYFNQQTSISKNAKIQIQADLSNIKEFAFKGMIKMTSDFKGFESYWADIDTSLTFEPLFKGYIKGQFHMNDWHYETEKSLTIELNQQIQVEYKLEYLLSYGDQIYDKKDLYMKYHMSKSGDIEGIISLLPKFSSSKWSAFLSFNKSDLSMKSYVILGNEKKYEFNFNITKTVMTLNLERTDEETGTKFNFASGNINWNLKKFKKQFVVNLTSDIPAVRNVKGQLVIQQRKNLAANFKLRVNSEDLTGFVRLISQEEENAGKVIFKVENNIAYPFTTNSSIQYSMNANEVTADLDMEVNGQKDWAKVNVKGSLPESFVRFKLPIENFKEFDLTVAIETEAHYGLHIDLKTDVFCFNLDGTSDILSRLNISSKLSFDCIGEPVYDFGLYLVIAPFGGSEAGIHLKVQKYGTLFRFKVNATHESSTFEVKIMSEIYPSHKQITRIFFSFERDQFRVEVHTKEMPSEDTLFLFKLFLQDNEKELEIEVGETKVISFKAEHNYTPENLMFNGSYSHTIFGYPFNAKATFNSVLKPDSGNIEAHLSTDAAFDHADFTMNYSNAQNFEGSFSLDTTNGNAEGKATVEKTDTSSHLKADMKSDLHSFKNYQFEVLYEFPENTNKIYVKSIQDEIKYEIHCSQVFESDVISLNMDVKLPFEKFHSFEINLELPKQNLSDQLYKFNAGFVLTNGKYEFSLNHMHDKSWREQDTTFLFSSPPHFTGNYNASLKYDFSNTKLVQFETYKGEFGIKGSWELSRENMITELSADLTYFKRGEYRFKANLPLKLYQGGELEFTSLQSKLNFDVHLLVGNTYKSGEAVLNLYNSDDTKTYSISYKYTKHLDIECHWDEWKINVRAKFTGRRIAVTSGTIDITSNFEGYEAIGGSWDFQYKKKVYSADISIDINQKGIIRFNISLSTQPRGVTETWKGAVLKVNFESPFTKHHTLNAEYNIPELKITTIYQYGRDTFEVNLKGAVLERKGNVVLSGNIPVNYISNFSFNFEYNFQSSFKTELKVNIEETFLEVNFDSASDFFIGQSRLAWTSPFTDPLDIKLKWAFDNSPFTCEASWKYGTLEVGFNTKLEYLGKSATFYINIVTPIKAASEIRFEAMYDVLTSDVSLSSLLKINDYFLRVESELSNASNKFALKAAGSINMPGLNGSLSLDLEDIEDTYNFSLTGETNMSNKFSVVGHWANKNIHFHFKYGNNSILQMNIDSSRADVKFAFQDLYLNLTSLYEKTAVGYKIEFSIESSEMYPLSIKANVSVQDQYEGHIEVKYGEKEYNVNGSLSLTAKQSAIEFNFESSEDIKNPIALSAMYNVQDFIQGRMKSESDIALISFEWGDKISISLKGQRRGKHTKINLELSTPFDIMPKLQFGYEGDFLLKGLTIDFSFNSFIEWTEKITTSGSFKKKNDKINSKLTLETPFSALETFSFVFQRNKNHLEASIDINNNEWTASCDYEVSPKFSVSLIAKTPIDGFRDISLNTSAALQDNKFNAEMVLKWENTKTITLKIVGEMWNLEIHLNTPWEQVKNVLFKTALRTESEELMYTLSIKWNLIACELNLIFSPVRLQLDGKYFYNNLETGNATFSYRMDGESFDLKAYAKTPFKAFRSGEIILHLSPEKSNLSIKIPSLCNFYMIIEAKDYWTEMNIEGSFNDPKGDIPYVFKINYNVEPESYALTGSVKVTTDTTWISVDVDFTDDWKAQVSIYDKLITMKFSRSEQGDIQFDYNMGNAYTNIESLDFSATLNFPSQSEVNGSISFSYKMKGQGIVRNEMIWKARNEEHQVAITASFDSSLLEVQYGIKANFPKTNVFKDNGKVEIVFTKKGEDLYKVTYEAKYLQHGTFIHVFVIETPKWTADASVSLTRSNFKISLSYPDEETKHTFVVSWPREISLEKLTLQAEVTSPYLREGDVNILFDFSVQNKFHYTVASSFSYGDKTVEVDGKFHYRKREKTVEFEADVKSEWIGNYSVKLNANWLQNVTALLKVTTGNDEHKANLVIEREEYTAEITLSSPKLPSKEIKITGMLNKDVSSNNISFKANLEQDGDEYILEGKLDINYENYAEGYFVFKEGYKHMLKISGKYELQEKFTDINFNVQIDIADVDFRMNFKHEDNEEIRSMSAWLKCQYIEIYLDIDNSKDWRKWQHFYFRVFNSMLRVDVTLGEEEGRFEINFDIPQIKFAFEVEYDLSEEIEIELNIRTPYDNLEVIDFEFEWSIASNTKEINFFYQWYDDNISLKFLLIPDSIFGWAVKVYLTTPFNGYESFSLQTPQFDSNKNFIVLIEYPSGKVGLQMQKDIDFETQKINKFAYSLYLPFEKYEIISLRSNFRRFSDLELEMRVGKVGITFMRDYSREASYYQYKTLIRINEYKTESYFRIYSLNDQFRFKIHFDFEMEGLSDIKFFDLESRYDSSQRFKIIAKTDQEDLIKIHLSWGKDKVVALTTPKRYPAYLIFNIEMSREIDDYHFEVGLLPSTSPAWKTYGLHLYQKQLGYGRDLYLSGKADKNFFAVDGTITLNPIYKDNFYINERFSIQMNERKAGFVTHLKTDFGFFEDSYLGDLQIILPEQVVQWDTNATCSGARFKMLSRFRWNNLDHEEVPVTLTVNYKDLSTFNNNNHDFQAVFSHPQIQNLTLQGNITCSADSALSVTTEFTDENDLSKNIIFKLNSSFDPESKIVVMDANITQPSTDFTTEFNARISDSVFNSATYQVKYWSQIQQKWEILELITDIESIDHGWQFTANINKSDSNWGYNYNGTFIHRTDLLFFDIIGVSHHFMDYWKFETSVNKYLPEADIQLQIGQSKHEPNEIGRVRAGLHSPLELGVIIDHERFGVWRQDIQIGLRLLNRELLQFIVEFDTSFDLADESLAYRLISPASKISNIWLRDISYAFSGVKKWTSTESKEILKNTFNQDTFLRIRTYFIKELDAFKSKIVTSLEDISYDIDEYYTRSVKPHLDSTTSTAIEIYESLQPYLEELAIRAHDSWLQLLEFLEIQYVRAHDRILEDIVTLSYRWHEIQTEMTVVFRNMMYTVVRSTNSFVEYVDRKIKEIQVDYGPTFDRYRQTFERYIQDLESSIGTQCFGKFQQEINKAKASLSEILYKGQQFIQPAEYIRLLQSFQRWIVEVHKENKKMFEDGMSQLQEAVTESQTLRDLTTNYHNVVQFVSEIKRDGLVATFSEKYAEAVEGLVPQIQLKYEEMREYISGSILFDYLEAWTGYPLNRLFTKWDQWVSDEAQILKAYNRLQSIFGSFKNLVTKNGTILEESLIIDPKVRGKIMYNQYLPFPWNNFLEVPRWHKLARLFTKPSPVLKAKRKLAEGRDVFYNTIDAIRIPGSNLPPFTATATVYGQQITTFDLFSYQFLGGCSYLMSKDFVGGDFEIVGDYNRADTGEISLASLTIRAGDTDVTLNVDGTYNANNMGEAQVVQEGNYVAFKQGALFVTCNSISRGCSVTVGSKYFGKLAGLFGNYNYEPSDDSLGPDGSKAREGNDIANNWAVSTNTCYQANQVIRVDEVPNIKNLGMCTELFLKSSSPFRNCFRRYDPRPFFWHCVRDMERPSFNSESRNTACDAVAAYRTRCATRSISLPSLPQCLESKESEQEAEDVAATQVGQASSRGTFTCEVKGQSVPGDWTETYESATEGSVDVAFIIELAKCNEDKNLQLLHKLIKGALRKGGVQDIQYALVTTQEDRVVDISPKMISEEELLSKFESLVLEAPKSENGGSEAVKAAARDLRWRPGVSRNIVHLSCRACDDGQSVSEALAENDVTYHIITRFKVVINGPNAKKSKVMASKVYGFDTKRIYTPKDTNKFTGNVNLRKLFQDPEEASCMEAAQSSGGSIYNVNKWTSKSAVVEKKYLGVIGQSVLKSSHAPECQECRCLSKGEGGEVSCRKCDAQWPHVETQEAVTDAKAQAPSRKTTVQRRVSQDEDKEKESNAVFQAIKQSFKTQFIEENAAFAQLEQNQEGASDGGGEDEVQEEGEKEEEEEEEEEEESFESDSIEDDYDYY